MSRPTRLTGRSATVPPAPPGLVPILVVDDNPAKLMAARAMLAPLGYHIVEADSGVAALRCVTALDFAVILLDVRMPIMNGFETAALIRMRPQSEMTPIIFITAFATDEIGATDRYAQGAADFITAPVKPEELRAKVSAFGGLYRKAQELAARASEVQESADRLRLLTEAAPIGIFQTDHLNQYIYTNPRWSEITGIAPSDAQGQAWDFIIDSGQRVALSGSAGVPDPSAGGPEFSYRFELGASVSETRVVLLNSKSVRDTAGSIVGWVGTLSDVSAVALAEAAMVTARDVATTASQLKSDFLANMSHEIRTPMNGVIGMTDLLLETDLDERQRDYALTVRNSGEALLTVINDILDFSKIESGMLEIEDIDFSVPAIVGDVVDLLKLSAVTKGLELTALVNGAVPSLVGGDPGRLRQVLTNLVGNAVKFTQAGRVVVCVTVDPADGPDAEGRDQVLRFEVSDTGVGILADQQETIFEPFVQADTSTSRTYGGTGLGLAITGQLVALMGGTLGVISEPGQGSTFWFTVRLHSRPGAALSGLQLAEERQHTARGVAEPRSGSTGTRHLLLAEDNLINQKVAVVMLTNAGYEVETVLNGNEAVKAVADNHYDAILMDCQMPELNGYEATAAIRAQEGAARHTPIIALTAGARHEDRERCLAAGMDDYLSKPMSKDALLAMVAKVATRPLDSPDAA